jgi:hypothetical protein
MVDSVIAAHCRSDAWMFCEQGGPIRIEKPPVITKANSSMVGNPYFIGITEELPVIRSESLARRTPRV